MEVVYERCCGLDVHKRTVVACAVTPQGRETRTFGTTTGELVELADWLKELDAIPGVGCRTAQVVLAEIGTEMSRFPSAAHLASWARLCPGMNESAGKRKSASTGQGNRWLRAVLVQAAHAAARTNGSALAAEFKRIAARAGVKRAAVAVAHSILKAIYYMILRGTPYDDRPHPERDIRSRTDQRRAAVRQLERLGYKAQLEAA